MGLSFISSNLGCPKQMKLWPVPNNVVGAVRVTEYKKEDLQLNLIAEI
jgi:hypothetical protein